jgi:hypothetical protein
VTLSLSTHKLSLDFGKMFLLIILLALLQPSLGIELKMVGHLAYTASKPGAVNVNPKVVNFYRQFDMRLIQKSLDFADNYGHHYEHFCSLLRSDPNIHESVLLVPSCRFDATPNQCKNMGHINFELRTKKDGYDILTAFSTYKQNEVWAPLRVRNGALIYISNHSPNEWLRVRSCPKCPILEDVDWVIYGKQQKEGKSPIFAYVLDSDDTVFINVTYHHHFSWKTYNIACKSRIDDETSTFNKLAKHSCKRDVAEIYRTNDFLRAEFTQIANPSEVATTKEERVRKRRAVALIGAGILGIEALSNAFGSSSPLSHIGKGISYALGIATHSDVQLTRQELQRHAQAIDALNINQKQLADAYHALSADVRRLIDGREQTQHDLAVLFVNFDNKANIYRVQSIIQDT